MWYLIVPPIIVVLSLAFSLWYLSRKGADPHIAERMAEMEKLPKADSFSGVKAFFLKVLEKIAQRIKVGTLRMHNSFGAWSQSIRESRRRVQENARLSQQKREEEKQKRQDGGEDSPAGSWKRNFLARKREDSAPRVAVPEEEDKQLTAEKPSFDEPLRRRPRALTEPLSEISQPGGAEPRPMVSDRMARPERSGTEAKREVKEEDLIARIARNPKDFAAYEALGDYYMDHGGIKDAKECYRQVLKLSPAQRMVKIKIRRLEKMLS